MTVTTLADAVAAHALALPDAYGLGRHGWVTLQLGGDDGRRRAARLGDRELPRRGSEVTGAARPSAGVSVYSLVDARSRKDFSR
jgi:hypothetical protein